MNSRDRDDTVSYKALHLSPSNEGTIELYLAWEDHFSVHFHVIKNSHVPEFPRNDKPEKVATSSRVRQGQV